MHQFSDFLVAVYLRKIVTKWLLVFCTAHICCDAVVSHIICRKSDIFTVINISIRRESGQKLRLYSVKHVKNWNKCHLFALATFLPPANY